MRDDAGEWQIRRIGVVAAAHDLEVGRDGAQVVVGCAVCEVAETEGLADFAGCEKFLELGRVRLAGALKGWDGEVEGKECVPLPEYLSRGLGCVGHQ